MSTEHIDALILEIQLIKLKKDSQWWLAWGVGLLFVGLWYLSSFVFILYPYADGDDYYSLSYSFFLIPLILLLTTPFIIGALALWKGFGLLREWKRINNEYILIIGGGAPMTGPTPYHPPPPPLYPSPPPHYPPSTGGPLQPLKPS